MDAAILQRRNSMVRFFPMALQCCLAIALLMRPVFAATPDAKEIASWSTWENYPTVPSGQSQASESSSNSRIPNPPAGESVAAWQAHWSAPHATTVWTNTALQLITKYQPNPLRAARALTLLHVAMYDAIVLTARATSAQWQLDCASHVAGSQLMDYLFPQELPGRYLALGYSAAHALGSANAADPALIESCIRISRQVAVRLIDRARNDGSERDIDSIERTERIPNGPGLWRPTPPLNSYRPLEPLAGTWLTWAVRDGEEFQAPPPVTFDSPQYWDEVREVKDVYARLTPAQKATADFWNLGLGSVSPAGMWNQIALSAALENKLATAETVQLFAAMNVAMMDALISCWNTKFRWWTQRPVTVIRERYDPNFLPYLVTPTFPSYVSGHSTISAAAAEVLGTFFPKQRDRFRAQAEEAAHSRLYGGIHFTSDNNEGLKLGKRIGERVVQKLARGTER